jgi:hypothetical protein
MEELWDGELALMHYISRGILGACVFLPPYKSQIFIMITGTACIAVLIYDW